MREVIRFGVSPGSVWTGACVGRARWVDGIPEACFGVHKPGFAAAILVAFQEALGKGYRFRLVNIPDDGSNYFELHYNAIASGAVDFSGDLWAWTEKRAPRVTYAAIVANSHYFYFLNSDVLSSSHKVIPLTNTSPKVWLLMILATVLISLPATSLPQLGKKMFEHSSMWVWQPGPVKVPKTAAFLLFLILSSFYGLNFNNSMKANLTPVKKLPFTDREEFARLNAERKVSLVTSLQESAVYLRWENPISAQEFLINESLTTNPPIKVTSFERALSLVRRNAHYVTDNFWVPKSIPSDTVIIRDGKENVNWLFLLGARDLGDKSRRLAADWQNAHGRLREELRRISAAYQIDGERVSESSHTALVPPTPADQNPIILENLSRIFRLWLVGAACSLLTLLSELRVFCILDA